MSVSLGLRYEFYPLVRRADRGLEVFNFNTNLLDICGVAGNAPTCGITVQHLLFSPRLGWSYRLSDTTGDSGRLFAESRKRHFGYGSDAAGAAFPVTDIVTIQAPNSYSTIGNLSQGVPVVPVFNLNVASVTPNAAITTYRGEFKRGEITSFNVTVQKLLPRNHNVSVGYVATHPNGLTRTQNLNYGTLGGGTRASRITRFWVFRAPSVCRPIWVTRSSTLCRQASQNGSPTAFNTPPPTHGLKTSIGGRDYSSTAVLVAQQRGGEYQHAECFHWHPRLRSAFRNREAISRAQRLRFESRRGVADQRLPERALRLAIHCHLELSFFERRHRHESNGKPGAAERSDSGRNRIHPAVVQRARIPPGDHRGLREFRLRSAVWTAPDKPRYQHLPGFFHPRKVKLQFRIQALNTSNTPHFANPAANVSNLQLNSDGSIKSLNGFGVITSTIHTGRQYDERELEMSARFSF